MQDVRVGERARDASRARRWALGALAMLAVAGVIAVVAGRDRIAKKGSTAQETPAEGRAAPKKRDPQKVVAPDDPGICATICARSEPLNCRRASECAGRCEKMRALPVCREEMRAALRCFALVPALGWACDGDGSPSVGEGQCAQEQAGFAACLSRHSAPR